MVFVSQSARVAVTRTCAFSLPLRRLPHPIVKAPACLKHSLMRFQVLRNTNNCTSVFTASGLEGFGIEGLTILSFKVHPSLSKPSSLIECWFIYRKLEFFEIEPVYVFIKSQTLQPQTRAIKTNTRSFCYVDCCNQEPQTLSLASKVGSPRYQIPCPSGAHCTPGAPKMQLTATQAPPASRRC